MFAYELAQMNVARLRAPLDSPQLAGFVVALDRINALADAAPGFVWRLEDDLDATTASPLGDDYVVNLSVWRDAASLQAFVYRSDHAAVMKRRRDWFEKTDIYLVLWWVPRGHRPSAADGVTRLDLLRDRGPTAEAFDFGRLFPEPACDAQQPGCMPLEGVPQRRR
jgi:hypothetical protein